MQGDLDTEGFIVVIPARYGSTRLPGKALADIGGKPMLQHVFELATRGGAARVIVATDDARIRDTAARFGATVCMTSARHQSGTERLAEAVAQLSVPDDEIVVNVQGDEPLLPPDLVTQVARNLACQPSTDMATLCAPIAEEAALFDPNVVKVVVNRHRHALYFSRAPIPWCRDAFAHASRRMPSEIVHRRHIGIYAYRAAFLKRYAGMPASALAEAESLEQLRALDHGAQIHVADAIVPPGPGVDTPADLERVRALMGMAS